MKPAKVSLGDILKNEYGIYTEADLDAAIHKLGAIDISVFNNTQQRKGEKP